jgi:hypothetical protein
VYANYERSRAAMFAIAAASKKLLELALLLGSGANNIDEILVEVRKHTTIYNEQTSIHQETKLMSEEFSAGREAAREEILA